MDKEEEESRAQAFHAQFGWVPIICRLPKKPNEILEPHFCEQITIYANNRWCVIGEATHADNQKFSDWIGKKYIRMGSGERSYRIRALD